MRALGTCGAFGMVLGVLTACTGGVPSADALGTAVTNAQASLPGVQQTAVAAATLASNLVSDPGGLPTQVGALLSGVRVALNTTPPGAPNDQVTEVVLSGTDPRGALTGMDPVARQGAASAALVLAGRAYPNATVSLRITDAAGQPVLTGSTAPGQLPHID
jgi:hypothetical protein